MRWKTEESKPGDKRIVKYFAFLPTTLTDGWTVWLESYFAEEEYTYYTSEGNSKWAIIKTWLFAKPDTTKPSAGNYIKSKK